MILGILIGVMESLVITGAWMHYLVLVPDKKVDRKTLVAAVGVAVLAVVMNLLMWRKQYRPVTYGNLIQIFIILAVAAGVDYKKHIIPNRLVAAGAVSRLVLLLTEGFLYPEEIKSSLIMSVAGMAVCLVFMLFLSFLTKHGIGFGDVKLFAWIGFSVGIMEAYYILFYSVLLTAAAAIFLLCTKKADRKGKLPFAPFVFGGCYLVFVMSFLS